jgi:uncharacterized protein (DUF2141 family)
MQRTFATGGSAAALRRAMTALVLGATATAFAHPGATRVLASTIDVTVGGVRSSRGQLLIALHDRAGSFPSQRSGAMATTRLPAGQRLLAATFRDVPPGSYALIAVHDEDGHGQMTKSRIGFPLVGFGTSNTPALLGRPWFRPARVTLDGSARIMIRMVCP